MVTIRPLTQADIPAAVRVWQETGGRSADTAEGLARYLARNPGLSFVADVGGTVIGLAVCGHDGRRGYLPHLGVLSAYRRKGIGRRLADCCFEALRENGIIRLHLQFPASNTLGRRFWNRLGCRERSDTTIISILLSESSEGQGEG